jgi:hypothetical protein
MKIARYALALTVVASLTLACDPAAPEPAPAETASEPDAVEYEPAYPDEVSDEELSAADTDQQMEHTHLDGTSHSHGAEDDHDHGDGDHDHGDGEDHDH